MTIDCKQNGTELTMFLHGRLDSTTASQLDDVIKNHISSVNKLILDCTSLEYLSSAGMRVLPASSPSASSTSSASVKSR